MTTMPIISLANIAQSDVDTLNEKDKAYAGSWKKRGGTGAFMMLARKWDRIENAVINKEWDIFTVAIADERPEGILDDIKDLRCYLLLVEQHVRQMQELKKHHAGTLQVCTPAQETPVPAGKIERMVPRNLDGMEHPFGFNAGDEK